MSAKRAEYKKYDELSAWDLDKGCRRIIDQSTPSRRKLRDILRRQARKRISRKVEEHELSKREE